MVEIAVIIAVLIGFSEVAKKMGLPEKYVPLMNLVLGIVAGMVGGFGVTLFESILTGAIIGLSASGLYDQKKITRPE